MKRRAFLATSAATAAQALSVPMPARGQASPRAGTIHTVRGPIDAGQMGVTLVHEHVLVDFAGAEKVSRSRYDAEEAFRTILPHLQDLQNRGCRTLLECTPAYLGRDPLLLRRLSEASGLNIVTNTGYYGAASDIAVPRHAYAETARQLADRWTSEARLGIEGTAVRPGFVKIGVDAGPLSDIDRKLVEAGALCHLDTGLTLAVHTGDGAAAIEIVSILKKTGVSPEAYVWVHPQNERDRATHSWAAQQGVWLELDGVSPKSLEVHVEAVVDLLHRDQLDRVLVSQDAGWYRVGEPKGGAYRPHTFLFDAFVPALRAGGLNDADLRTLLVENPARAFAVRRRALPGAA
ncbi:MAG TPA: phosphotriesterase [Vicinamibacteria bacterium]|nr:phosphotriesterase [Vicinamibacteria bacterium]